MCFRRPHSFNHLVMIAAIPRKGRDEGIVRSRSCDGPNILRSRILRTTGSRPRSPLRRTIYRSGELTFSCKSSILLLSKVMLGCFTQVRFARPHDEHVLSELHVERLSGACGHSFLACSNPSKELQIRFYTTYDIPFRPSLALCLVVQGACPRGLLRSPRTCITT